MLSETESYVCEEGVKQKEMYEHERDMRGECCTESVSAYGCAKENTTSTSGRTVFMCVLGMQWQVINAQTELQHNRIVHVLIGIIRRNRKEREALLQPDTDRETYGVDNL